jgi:nitrogen regulatory protein PII
MVKMFLILFVLNDPERLDDLLTAWEGTGVSGATIFRSSGLGRIRMKAGLWDDVPLIPSLEALYQRDEDFNRTLFTVVPDQAMVERVVQVTQQVVGDLSKPHSGLLVVLPVAQAYGLEKKP